MEICTSVTTIKTRSMGKEPFFGSPIVREMPRKKSISKCSNMRGCGGAVFLMERVSTKKSMVNYDDIQVIFI